MTSATSQPPPADPAGGAPTADEVRAAIDRLVTSEVFVRSPQLGAFLRFTVEAVLRGNADRIKAYTIGVEVLRRDTKFDPQIDPIVRVEATRLRRAIERYYAGPGADDPVIIDLPRGSYVPVFQRRRLEFAPALQAPRPQPLRPPRRVLVAAAALVLLAGVVGAALLLAGSRGSVLDRAASRNTADASLAGELRPGNGMPTLAVDRIAVVGVTEAGAISPFTLVERMSDAFARFETINITSDLADPASASPASATAIVLQIDYRLGGSIEYLPDRSMTLRFRLVETDSGSVAWTRTFERLFQARDAAAVEEGELAMTLLQPFGVIRSRERVKQLATGGGDPRYRCAIESAQSLRSFDPDQHGRSRTCLEHLTASDPSFATGYRYLAAIYLREYEFGLGGQPSDPTPCVTTR
jgi:hypothetical protein